MTQEGDHRPEILFAVPTLGMGGAERVFTTLLRHIDPMSFRLRLAVGTLARAALRDEIPDHVEVCEMGGRARTLALALTADLWRRPADIVISTVDHLNIALCGTRPFWPGRTRHIVRATSVENLRRWPYRLGMGMLYRRADAVVFQSSTMREHYGEIGVRTRRGLVINNPVDQERIRGRAGRACSRGENDPPHLVAVGRLVAVKGYDLLIRAVAMMPRKPQVTIIGDGPAGESLGALARSLGVSDHVHLPGALANPYPAITAADGFILSSRSEGFPNTVLESLALGTPVVATPVAGLASLLNAVPGCRIASSITAEGLADSLAAFCAERPGRVDTDCVADYDAPAVASRYAGLFEDIIRQA